MKWQSIVNIAVAFVIVGGLVLGMKVLDLKQDVKILKKRNTELKKELGKRETTQEASHQRALLRLHIDDSKKRIRDTRKLMESFIVVTGQKAQHSIWAQDEMLRILGLPPYNHPSLAPRSRDAQTIYHRFRSWQGRKGYHFCCIARMPSKKEL